MHMRVVRFTDVSAERVEGLLARVGADGPPPDLPIVGLKILFDEGQGTAVVLQYFETAEDLGFRDAGHACLGGHVRGEARAGTLTLPVRARRLSEVLARGV